MLDLIGPSPARVVQLIREEQEHRFALYWLLLNKGVFTEEEYQAALMQSKHLIEQMAAEYAELSEEKKALEFLAKVTGDDTVME